MIFIEFLLVKKIKSYNIKNFYVRNIYDTKNIENNDLKKTIEEMNTWKEHNY